MKWWARLEKSSFWWIHRRRTCRSKAWLHRGDGAGVNCFAPKFTHALRCLGGKHKQSLFWDLFNSLSPAGTAPSISDSLPLNWHKYLPFTMCQLFLQCQRIREAQNERCCFRLCTLCLYIMLHFMPHIRDWQSIAQRMWWLKRLLLCPF